MQCEGSLGLLQVLVTAVVILLSWSYAQSRYIYRGVYIVGVHLLKNSWE